MRNLNIQNGKCLTVMSSGLTFAHCCAEQLTNPTRTLLGVQITNISLSAQYGAWTSPHLSCKVVSLDSCSVDRLSSRESSSRDVVHAGITCHTDHSLLHYYVQYCFPFMCLVIFCLQISCHHFDGYKGAQFLLPVYILYLLITWCIKIEENSKSVHTPCLPIAVTVRDF